MTLRAAPTSRRRFTVPVSCYQCYKIRVGGWQDGDRGTGVLTIIENVGQMCPPPFSGDLNGDGVVNAADLAQLLANGGPCAGCAADLDGDGTVGPSDLAILLGNWS
jgi:hypothetical protein